MIERIVSYDGGNGKVSAAGWRGGKLRQITLPHARARVSMGLRKDSDAPFMGYTYADFAGERWAYGDGIFQSTELVISTHQNSAFRYGDPAHIFWLLVCLAEMGYESGDIRLVISVPPGVYHSVKDYVKKSLMDGIDGEGNWPIRLSRDKAERVYRFKTVLVITEGFGAYAGYCYDLQGQNMEVYVPDKDGMMYNPLMGTITVGDAGAGTYDQYNIVNGMISLESVTGSTDPNGGVLSHVLQPIVKEVERVTGLAGVFTAAHADYWLRTYLSGNKAAKAAPASQEASQIVVQGVVYSLKDLWDEAIHNYARWVVENKVDVASRAGITSYMPVGGGWMLAFNYIRQWRPNINFVYPSRMAHTKGRTFSELNVLGALSYAIAKAQQTQ